MTFKALWQILWPQFKAWLGDRGITNDIEEAVRLLIETFTDEDKNELRAATLEHVAETILQYSAFWMSFRKPRPQQLTIGLLT